MPSAIETIEIKGVSEGAFQYLMAHIITGHLAPGSKLSETELASQLEISRPPLREAFRRLENERLVVSIPRKGCYVAEISLENCHEICQVWEMIELFAIDLLRSKADKDLREMDAVLSKASDLPAQPSSDPFQHFEYLKMISAFHIKLVEAAKNVTLTHLYNSILPSLARYQSMFISDSAAEEHQTIMRLIQDGNYQEAKKLLLKHIRHLCDQMETKLADRERDPDEDT